LHAKHAGDATILTARRPVRSWQTLNRQ
jgi:hypothetical protein